MIPDKDSSSPNKYVKYPFNKTILVYFIGCFEKNLNFLNNQLKNNPEAIPKLRLKKNKYKNLSPIFIRI